MSPKKLLALAILTGSVLQMAIAPARAEDGTGRYSEWFNLSSNSLVQCKLKASRFLSDRSNLRSIQSTPHGASAIDREYGAYVVFVCSPDGTLGIIGALGPVSMDQAGMLEDLRDRLMEEARNRLG